MDVLIGGGGAIKIYPSGQERLVQTPLFVVAAPPTPTPSSISEVKVAVALASVTLTLSKSHRARITN